MKKKCVVEWILRFVIVFIIFLGVKYVFADQTTPYYDTTGIWATKKWAANGFWVALVISALHAFLFPIFFRAVYRTCEWNQWLKVPKIMILYWLMVSGIMLLSMWIALPVSYKVLAFWGGETFLAIFLSALFLTQRMKKCE